MIMALNRQNLMSGKNGFAESVSSVVELLQESRVYACLSGISARCSSAPKKLLRMLSQALDLYAERSRAFCKKLLISRQKVLDLATESS